MSRPVVKDHPHWADEPEVAWSEELDGPLPLPVQVMGAAAPRERGPWINLGGRLEAALGPSLAEAPLCVLLPNPEVEVEELDRAGTGDTPSDTDGG